MSQRRGSSYNGAMSEKITSEGVPEEEIVPRGQEIYESSIRPGLLPQDEGKFVVIDVLGGGYAMDDEEEEAFARASEQASPEALFFFARVGQDGTPGSCPPHRRVLASFETLVETLVATKNVRW